LDVKIALHVDV